MFFVDACKRASAVRHMKRPTEISAKMRFLVVRKHENDIIARYKQLRIAQLKSDKQTWITIEPSMNFIFDLMYFVNLLHKLFFHSNISFLLHFFIFHSKSFSWQNWNCVTFSCFFSSLFVLFLSPLCCSLLNPAFGKSKNMKHYESKVTMKNNLWPQLCKQQSSNVHFYCTINVPRESSPWSVANRNFSVLRLLTSLIKIDSRVFFQLIELINFFNYMKSD